MVEIGLGFIKRCERIILRSGAVAESCDLRKNEPHPVALFLPTADLGECCVIGLGLRFDKAVEVVRSEERRVGKGCVSKCRSRWSPVHYKQNNKTTQNQ